jgi:hypothetical protein
MSNSHFKIPINSMKSGIPWTKRNPVQKLNIVLVGASVAITPINKDNGVAITINPKQHIRNDNLLFLIFGNPDIQNKPIPIAIKTNKSPVYNKLSNTSNSKTKR